VTKGARDYVVGHIALFFLWALGKIPADTAIDFAGRTARRFGPLSGRHKVAVGNLKRAYPEKSEDEVQQIARGMWENMGRLAAEYIFIDELFDFDPETGNGKRVTVEGDEIFLHVAAEQKPHILFTGHLGNFEMLPVAGMAFGMPVTSLFRAPNNKYIAEYIFRTRKETMGGLLASRRGAALELARILDAGGNVGMLVDQKFMRGIATTFYGRACQTSPLLPKLARQFECDVYPVVCRRQPGNTFHLKIEPKRELPRTDAGHVDIAATAQLLNDVVERWVREDPAQWMWFHKRWK
jgi:Kdo2-lipid IVA lauroyltransferase/acyltransferase